MHCHLMVYMRIIISTLITLTCLLGDNFVELTTHPLLKALGDNATHAAIGALSGIAFAVQFYERTTHFFGWVLIFTCFSCSSLIDVDHFIAARSWNLEKGHFSMHCHLMVYMRIIISTLITLTCLLGDNFVELTTHPLLKALGDNATHAAIGALSGIAFAVQFYERTTHFFGWVLIFTCFSCSSLIDVDHFIAARSWNLEDATNLSRRPFLHCSTIIILISIGYVCTSCLNYFKWSLFLGVVLCAFITHHTRDAIRRGYWFYPWGNTDKLPNLAYIIITIATPYIVGYIHAFCRSVIVQQYLSQYIKFNESCHHKDKGYRYMQV